MQKRILYTVLTVGLILTLFLGITRAEFVAEGVKLTKLTDDGKSKAIAWSKQGDHIAYVREISDSQDQLMVMKSDGTGIEAITEVGNPFFAEWSWDGTKLAYEYSNADEPQSQGGVFIYDLATKRSTSISAPYPRISIDENDGPFWSSDDRYVAYQIEYGPSETEQTWVADVQSGKYWWILADRGESKEQRWSPSAPQRLCLLVSSSGGEFDAATVDPQGTKMVLLTEIGAQSVQIDEPRWSPTGELIAFTSNLEMTQDERDKEREDCWVAKPDGSESRNLTKGSSPATEEQLELDEPIWSWDGRWILMEGKRFDNQGNDIATYYLIDPINGGYEAILTSHPRKDRTYNDFETAKWSYDSTKIAFITERSDVQNWGPNADYIKDRDVLSIYDVRERKEYDLLLFDEEIDRKKIFAKADRERIHDMSWSPDGRSIVFSIANIVSAGGGIRYPDIYKVDLPEHLIDASAPQHIGPPIGRERAAKLAGQTPPPPDPEQPTEEPAEGEEPEVDAEGYVTETVKPLHMTIDEAVASLPAHYQQFFTVNASRNLLLFKGEPAMLESLRADLEMIDTPAPHILVDMLAVELSDEATRVLGLDWTYAEGHFGFFQPEGNPIQVFPHSGPGLDLQTGFPSGALDSLQTVPGVGQSFYQGVGTLPREFFIRLNTLVKDGDGRILANPRTVGMSGKESLIQIRKTLNYFFNEGFDVSGRPIIQKSDISADTEGRIVSTLLDDGKIHLLVDVKVGSFTFTQQAGLPEQTTRHSTTEVSVNEGQTLVLGGLRQQEMTSSVTKVPILGDIPIIAPLFRREEKSVINTVLTIFITPRVLKPDEPTPDWPQVDPSELEIDPIIDEPATFSRDPNDPSLIDIFNGNHKK